jgi:hypothetical protein
VNTLNIEYAVFCMERVRLPVVFADIPDILNLKAAVTWRGFFFERRGFWT